MHRLLCTLPLWLLSTLLYTPILAAQSVASPSLQDALVAALQRGAAADPDAAQTPYRASSWLAGLPSLGLSYLGSDQRYGTDETELYLNLPLKSGPRRQADRALQGLAAELDELGQQQRRLFYSGLLRQVLWSYRLADTRRRSAADKRLLLLQLEERQRDLLAANATSEYGLLLLQSEIVEVEIAQQEYLQQARRWRERYRQLTGLDNMPLDIREPAVTDLGFAPNRDPRLRALEVAHSQRGELLRANSATAADWNISVTAKNLDTAGYDEQQYGLGLEIPLSAFDVARQSDNVEWRTAQRDYLLARDQLLAELRGTWEGLLNERDGLLQKRQLLQRSQHLAERITEQLARLQASNEIAQEIILRRSLDAIDSRAAVVINETRIEQNNAMLRQAAGVSL